ncbi:MAG TPA: low temperature requirement protein A [Thermoleophilaceae bacterium]|nr:low temperature requirement protein A [Thermoleophilaceae bacterium]
METQRADVIDDGRVLPERVSTLELFFDLVFVFTITQLTTVLVEHPNARGVFRVVLMLAVIWWMYGGYAWLTNAVPPDRPSRQLLLLGAMGSYLVLALSVPQAFSGAGLSFGIAYALVVLVHMGLFSRSESANVTQAISSLARYNGVSALMVLAGGIAGGTAQYVLWAAAGLFEWLTPMINEPSGFEVGPAHFVERHGLVVIIAIGESVVAVGIGAAGLPIDLELVAVALLGLTLTACLWWTYFGGDDSRAEIALAGAPPRPRAIMAVKAFGYGHLPILLGIIAIAATLKHTIGHASDELDLAPALFLAGGAALFLLGDVIMRHTLHIGQGRWRALAAAVVLLTIPLGTEVAGVAQLAAVVLVMVGLFAWEAANGPDGPGRRRRWS